MKIIYLIRKALFKAIYFTNKLILNDRDRRAFDSFDVEQSQEFLNYVIKKEYPYPDDPLIIELQIAINFKKITD